MSFLPQLRVGCDQGHSAAILQLYQLLEVLAHQLGDGLTGDAAVQ
jgi:hypothetical protein